MSKWFEVTVKTVTVYAVEMDSDDENGAVDVVIDRVNGEFDEIEAEAVPEDEVGSVRRHADKVISL